MSGLEIASLNTQAGYGNRTGWTEKDGDHRDYDNSGAGLAGDLTLGLIGKKEDRPAHGKKGLGLVRAQADAIVGQANDRFMRFVLNVGPEVQADVTRYDGLRYAWLIGATARAEYSDVKTGDNGSTNRNVNLSFPSAVGIGTSHIFLQDRFELMTNFSDLRFINEASGSWRPYANFSNTFIQTVDIYLSHTYEDGKLPGGTTTRSTQLFAGIRLGLFNYTLK